MELPLEKKSTFLHMPVNYNFVATSEKKRTKDPLQNIFLAGKIDKL